jgi:hypothetical protein
MESLHAADHLTGPSPAALRLLLVGSNEFTEPARVLHDLDAAAAFTTTSGAPHCIGHILSHMLFWQRFMLGLMRQESPAYPSSEAAGWPEITPDAWPATVAAFLNDLATLQALTQDEAALNREYKPGATVGYLMCDAALHNAYHLGQIVMLRCMLGLWPPEGGPGYGYWP